MLAHGLLVALNVGCSKTLTGKSPLFFCAVTCLDLVGFRCYSSCFSSSCAAVHSLAF